MALVRRNGRAPARWNGSLGPGRGAAADPARGLPLWPRREPKRQLWRGPLMLALVSLLLVAAVGLYAVYSVVQTTLQVYAALSNDLPPLSAFERTATFKTVQLFDRKGRLLWELYDPNGGLRTPVRLDEVSQHVIDATLAAEDPTFFTNAGVDVRAILRAGLMNLVRGDVVSGASTITQQVVRNVMLGDEKYDRSVLRKLKEALLAYRVTEQYSKEQILEAYLNEIYYGHQAYGVEAAAQVYFNKHARDLTLPEAALIAGLPQAPSDYDPLVNLPAARARQGYVLDQMVKYGFISEAEAEQARRTPLALHPREVELRAPHFVMYVRSVLEERYGPAVLYQQGLRVYTSLDLELQEALHQVMLNNVENLQVRDASNAALAAVDPKTGQILAMHGSMDYWNAEIDGQVNVLTSERQPGSSIKPVIYATAFTVDYSPATVVQDAPVSYRTESGQVWSPLNFDRRFHGPVTIRTALGNSLNVPAVKTLEHIGIPRAVEQARKMGITTWGSDKVLGLSLTLGGAEIKALDLIQAYTVFANNGMKIPLTPIVRVVDAKGNVLEDHTHPTGEEVLDPRAAYQITSILSDDAARLITYGYPSRLALDRPAAAKTGTTDNYRDTWTMGYTPNLVIGVWVGNSDGRPMREVQSSMSAGKIWREAMETAFQVLKLPVEEFQRPPGLADRPVCEPVAGNRPAGHQCWNDLYWEERVDREWRPPVRPTPPQPPAPAQPAQQPPPAAPAPQVQSPANQQQQPGQVNPAPPGQQRQPPGRSRRP